MTETLVSPSETLATGLASSFISEVFALLDVLPLSTFWSVQPDTPITPVTTKAEMIMRACLLRMNLRCGIFHPYTFVIRCVCAAVHTRYISEGSSRYTFWITRLQ